MEQLVGKLVFTCMVCRWGFIFIQGVLDAVYPVTSGRPRPPMDLTEAVWILQRQLDLTEAVWSDLRFWLLALLGLVTTNGE